MIRRDARWRAFKSTSSRDNGPPPTTQVAFASPLPRAKTSSSTFAAVGFTPSLYTFGEGADTTLDVMLLPLAQQLDAVKVNARGSSGIGLEGFDQRMRDREHGAGSGYFITSAEIERRQATRATSLFDEVPGIFVLRVSFNRYSIFARSRTFSNGSGAAPNKCAATVYIDGTRMIEKFDNGRAWRGYRRAIDSQQHRGHRGLLERERRSSRISRAERQLRGRGHLDETRRLID